MSDQHIYIYKPHNKTLLLYHMVFSVKHRKSVITEEVGDSVKQIYIELSEQYEIHFVEVGYEGDHVHFLIQSVPTLSVPKIVGSVKSITAKQIFQRHPLVKERLWRGNFWTSGFYANTVGLYGNQQVIQRYIENQGNNGPYIELHKDQRRLFD